MIVESKMTMPVTRVELLHRRILHANLQLGLATKVTVITAPPGYGKTTLLGAWVASTGIQNVWLTFDPDDNHPVRFWSLVAASLEQAFPSFKFPREFYLIEYRKSLMAILLNVFKHTPREIVMIWDDFHHISDPDLLTELIRFIRLLPGNVHLYISARSKPSLQLSRLRAAEELIELEQEALRFTKKESDFFYNQCYDLGLSERQLHLLYERTEGWITGMKLAALSIAQNAHSSVIMEEFSGASQDFSNYYFDEIFIHLQEPIQRFLYRSSVLEKMSGDLCEVVTGRADSSRILFEMEKGKLFIDVTYENPSRYRFHQMFRQFLLQQLKFREPEQLEVIHLAAGRHLEAHGHLQEAIQHYSQAGAYDEAIHLLEAMSFGETSPGWEKLKKWIDPIPDGYLLSRPKLCLAHIIAIYSDGERLKARKRLEWIQLRISDPRIRIPEEAKEYLRKGILLLQAVSAYFENDYYSSLHFSKEYIMEDPQGILVSDLELRWTGSYPFKELYSQLRQTEILVKRLLELWEVTQAAKLTGTLHMVYAKLMYEWNDLDKAKQHVGKALEIGEAKGISEMITEGRILEARILFAEESLNPYKYQQSQALVQLQEEARAGRAEEKRGNKIHQYLAEYWLLLNNTAKAEEWLLNTDIQITDNIPDVQIGSYLLFARILFTQGKFEESFELAGRIKEQARLGKMRSVEIRCLVVQSLIHAEGESSQLTFNLLEEALALGEPEGFIRTFIDFGAPLQHLLKKYVLSRQGHHREVVHKVSLHYVKRLLQYMSEAAGALPLQLEEDDTGVTALLTEQEGVVVRMIHEGLSNRDIAAQLYISLSTVKTHVNNIYKKLGVNNRVLALKEAQRRNLL